MYQNKNTKSLPCKICGSDVENVAEDVAKVTCSTCVNNSLKEFEEESKYVQNNFRDSE